MSDHDKIDGTASGAYSLDALSPEERAAFEQALRESEDLRTEVAGFTDTAAVLAGAVEPVEPPARLRQNLLDMLDSVEQLPAESDAPTATELPSGEQQTPHSAAPVTSIDSARASHRAGGSRRRRPLTAALIAVAAAAALFFGGVTLGSALDGRDQQSPTALEEISAADDVQRIAVELPDGGSASLLASAELGRSVVIVEDADLPANEIYQAWYVRDGGPVSAGLIPAGDESYRVLEGSYAEGDVIALTREPAGGSEQPTTEPIAFVASA